MKPALRLVLVVIAMLAAVADARACTRTASATVDLGAYSPHAIRAGAIPALSGRAGLSCTPSTIVVLGNNRIQATFRSANGMKLRSGSNVIGYAASANPSGTAAFTDNGTVDYMQNNFLNVLGLLGGASADMPLYIRPGLATLPPPGVYTERITISWNWYLCSAVNALFVCIGDLDVGAGNTVIDISLTVAAQAVKLTTYSTTTWDPVNAASFPRAVPGGKSRLAVEAYNPDYVAADGDTLAIVMAVPVGTSVALDGDGASAGFVQFADGSPASTLTVSYAAPASTSDDVDFSADHGASWSYAPIIGDAASQAAVTGVRIRPRGALAAQSRFTVSLPIRTK